MNKINSGIFSDQKFISIALSLAKLAKPSPNPRVGCVIVKNNKIIGKGYHEKAGFDHAEIIAIKSVKDKKKLEGSTLYVTLEPCMHFIGKRTPSCANELLKYDFARIVIGCLDQNPKVSSINLLKKKFNVTVLNDASCKQLNESFFHYIKTTKPFVLLKMAMTLDSKIAKNKGTRTLISNAKSRKLANSWRCEYDAILVGVNTIIKDNPRLTCLSDQSKNPIRIILDSRLRIPLNAKVFKQKGTTIIATTKKTKPDRISQIEKLGVKVVVLPSDRLGYVNLKSLLTYLGKREITSIMVEGGSEVASSFVNAGLVNKVAFFIAPKVLGKGKDALDKKAKEKLGNIFHLNSVEVKEIGKNVLVQGYWH
ncbi:MAG: bifunctional diaminohydroxyphosphoribosylaminopyrimidine deaminase/5-amino-6-(5-phosphoribosylamino)uracil reductase RibD [Candidatus Micrarchaeota archaeon]